MQLKINWIIYLLFGAISICLFSCGKGFVSYFIQTTYSYSNLSDYPLNIKVFNRLDRTLIREIPIPSGDSAVIILSSVGSGAPPFFYDTFLDSIGDSVSVIFDNRKFLYYTIDTENSILDYRNYEGGKVSKTEYYFRFRFTNDDYNRAIVLK